MRNRIYLSLGALALLAICAWAACGQKTNTKQPETVSGDEAIPVRTVLVQQRQVALPIEGSGMLTSSAEQRLSFKVGGVIRKIYVDEGDVVRAGQLLAVLDKTEIDAQVAQANQALTKSERDLARVQGLYKDSSATLELLENATTGRDVAKETVRIATFNQAYAEIRATRSGKIVRKLMNDGEIVGPGMPVFVLFETGANDWVLKVNVSDRDWARLDKGMAAQVKLDAYQDVDFAGKVSDIAPTADPQSGLYPVEIQIDPRGKRFAPGLFGKVNVQSKQARNYAIIPIESIVEGDGKSAFVYALQADGQSVRKVPVQIAFVEGGNALVLNGLEQGTEVVTAGAPYLNEQKKVKKI